MPRTLRNLIRASGHAGVAGQSFRNHVVGAVSGTRMSDYALRYMTVDAPGTTLMTVGERHTWVLRLTQGSRFPLIRRGDTPSVTLTLSGAVQATAVVESVTLTSPDAFSVVVWITGGPPNNGLVTDYEPVQPVFTYRPDNGPFNDPVSVIAPYINVIGAGAPPPPPPPPPSHHTFSVSGNTLTVSATPALFGYTGGEVRVIEWSETADFAPTQGNPASFPINGRTSITLRSRAYDPMTEEPWARYATVTWTA